MSDYKCITTRPFSQSIIPTHTARSHEDNYGTFPCPADGCNTQIIKVPAPIDASPVTHLIGTTYTCSNPGCVQTVRGPYAAADSPYPELTPTLGG